MLSLAQGRLLRTSSLPAAPISVRRVREARGGKQRAGWWWDDSIDPALLMPVVRKVPSLGKR